MPGPGRQTPSEGESGSGVSTDRGLETGRLLRSAGTVGGLTLLSRVFGLVREAIVGALLGTSHVADAYGVGFQLSNSLRRLASEGNLSAAFIPVFSRVEERRPDEIWPFVARFHTAVALAVAAFTPLGVIAAGWLVPLLYAGYADTPGKIELAILLTRLLFAYAFFISLSAVLMAVLNARQRFAAAAFTPVLLNLFIISGGLAAWLSGAERPVFWIVGGVVAGGLAQWLFLVPFARAIGMPMRPRFDLGDRDVLEVGRLIVPRLIGVGVVQLNILVGQFLAAGLGEGALASLYYAARIQELTLGVFAVSVATVVLPTLSRQGARNDRAAMADTLSFALRQVTAITVPAAVGILLLRVEIVSVLFERGAFDSASTTLTAWAVAGYAVGVSAVAAVRVLAPGFYALHDTRTPVAVAGVGLIVNLVAALALREPLGNGGIALANSLAAIVAAGLLLWLLWRRLDGLAGAALTRSASRVLLASAGMAAAVTWVPSPFVSGGSGVAGAPELLYRVALGVVAYGIALVALRAPEVEELETLLRGRRPDSLGGRANGSPQGGTDEGS